MIRFLSMVFLLLSLAVSAQTNSENNGSCPRLIELAQDRTFVAKVAAENGLTTMRFLSQEAPTIRAMLIAYARKYGVCAG